MLCRVWVVVRHFHCDNSLDSACFPKFLLWSYLTLHVVYCTWPHDSCIFPLFTGKRSTCPEEEKAQTVVVHSPTTTATATDYLVPLSLGDQQQVVKVQPLVGDNPVYLTNVHRDMTSLWLQRQQQRSSEGLEHSYESMTHDYEDIFLESLNGGVVLMQSNEAYTIPRTLTYNSGHVLALYNSQ